MKKSQQIIGLPIISIAEGNEEGKVKGLVVNPERGTVDYFVVDNGIQTLSTRVVPSGNVLGIGEHAMTIPEPEAVSDISKLPAAIDLLQKNITVKGIKVLTKKGSFIGQTGDIYIDADNGCSISGIEYIADGGQTPVSLIPRSCVITYGKTLLVVEDDVQSKLLDDPSVLPESEVEFEQKPLEDAISSINEFMEPAASQEPEIIMEQAEAAATPEPATVQPEQKSSAAELFEERQKQYLKGRKATKNIQDNQGAMIIRAGEVITEQVMDRAKSCGKLIELVMNNEA